MTKLVFAAILGLSVFGVSLAAASGSQRTADKDEQSVTQTEAPAERLMRLASDDDKEEKCVAACLESLNACKDADDLPDETCGIRYTKCEAACYKK